MRAQPSYDAGCLRVKGLSTFVAQVFYKDIAVFALAANWNEFLLQERLEAVTRLNGLGFYTCNEQLCHAQTYQVILNVRTLPFPQSMQVFSSQKSFVMSGCVNALEIGPSSPQSVECPQKHNIADRFHPFEKHPKIFLQLLTSQPQQDSHYNPILPL
eukprot:4432097-Amphidinium_carterae.1